MTNREQSPTDPGNDHNGAPPAGTASSTGNLHSVESLHGGDIHDSIEESITEDPVDGMTLEELSGITGVPERTIRYYQAEKLLPKPERDRKDGRVARYSGKHRDRLKAVGDLRDRGLKLPAIRALLEEESPALVSDWLGLDQSLRGSWGHDEPRLISNDELHELLANTPPGTQGIFEDAGMFRRQGSTWLVPSYPLLDVAVGLVEQGLDSHLVIDASGILQKYMGKAADQLIKLFTKAVHSGFGGDTPTEFLTDEVRPRAGEAARIIFAQQLERSIKDLLSDTRKLRKR